MRDAPETLGSLFIRMVKQRDVISFQHLVGSTGYLWGQYLNSEQMTEEDQDWAIANRPEVKDFTGFKVV